MGYLHNHTDLLAENDRIWAENQNIHLAAKIEDIMGTEAFVEWYENQTEVTMYLDPVDDYRLLKAKYNQLTEGQELDIDFGGNV